MRSVQNVQTNNVKGHGYIKKTKAYGAVGAIAFMGALAIAGSQTTVFAQETDTEPVTTSETSDTVIQAEVISSDLDHNVERAEEAGVNVTEGEDQTYTSLEEAQADLNEQTAEIEKAIAEKEANNEQIKADEAYNAEVDKENAEGQAEVDEFNKGVDERNAAAKAEYDEKKAKYDADLEAYNKAKETIKTLDESGPTEVDMLPSGAWINFKPVEVIDGVKVYGEGTVSSVSDILDGGYNIIVYSENDVIKQDHIIKSIVWEGGVPEAVNPAEQDVITPYDQIQALYEANGGGNQLYNLSEGGTNTICSVHNGIWVRFKDAVTMYDGSKRDLEAQFTYAEGGGVPEIGWGYITLWNANGAINAYNGANYSNGMDDGLTRKFRIAGAEEGENFLWSTIVYDTDVGQYLYGNFNVLSVGGNQTANQNNVWSTEDPNGTVINPKWGYGVDASGSDSAPDSTSAIVTYGDNYTITTRNTPGGLGSATAVGDFGTVMVSPTLIQPPEEPAWKEEPRKEFTPKPHKDITEPVEVNAQYHKVFIEQTPGNEKSVQDKTGKDINGDKVATNSEAHWILGNDPLKAGRDFIKELTLTDELPSDFEIDLAKTAAASADYDVTYDSVAKIVTFVAKQAAIEALNDDLRNDVEIPMAIIVGHPTKDASLYPNTFTTHLTTLDAVFDADNPTKDPEQSDKENKIDIPSNEVIIYTPDGVEPKKEDFNEAGISIDGKTVNIGSTNVYKMLWHLNPYEGMEADADTIQKGFYYFDDYPEDAVTINKDDVNVVDPQGNEIAVTVTEYASIDEASLEVKDIVNANNLSFDGAFQVIKVNDTESFFERYVKTGTDLTVINPMTVKEEMKNTAKKYVNKAIQVDFGNAHATNSVENEVPKVDPVKEDLNSNGEDIDGKVVAAGSVNYYKLKWDLDQYEGMEEIPENIMKGFYYLDDYDEKAVTPLNDQVSFLDEAGNIVTGIASAVYDTVTAAPQIIQDAITKNGFDIKGALQVFSVEDPMSFYEKYVKPGINVYITTPMQVNMDMVGKYLNGGFQIDFGNIGYQTNIVENEVVTPDPKKVDLNEKGVDINGKMVLPGSVNVYQLTWDLDQYKDIEAGDEVIAKGFMFVDDYPEEALDLLTDAFRITDSDSNDVSGVSVTVFETVEDMPVDLSTALQDAGVELNGAFVLFKADDPQDFFNEYVATGKNLTITAPMKVKEEMGKTGGEYKNTGFQIDFGSGKQADIVVNNVPKMEVEKDVVIEVNDGKSINNETIQKGTVFNYQLTGALVPKDRSEELWDYSFIDDYQETHDEYNGVYRVFAKVDIKTNNGKTIQAGSDVTEYTTQEIDNEKGAVTIKFNEEFLRSIGLDSEFQAEAFLQMKRIAAGDVENSFINTVNGIEVVSNVVITHTPEDPVPGNPSVNTGVESGMGLWTSLAGIFGVASIVLAAIKRKFR